MRKPLALLLTLAMTGCSVGKPKQANDVDSSPIRAEPVDEPATEPANDIVDEPNDKPAPKPQPGHDDYEITYRDCQVLGRSYGNAWLNDEIEKLNARKLKEAQHAQMMEQLRGSSQTMTQQYQSECDKTVGSAQLRSRLACAVKAKNMQRFDDCLDGKVD